MRSDYEAIRNDIISVRIYPHFGIYRPQDAAQYTQVYCIRLFYWGIGSTSKPLTFIPNCMIIE